MIEVIQPDNKSHWLELRAKDITSTEVSALFGLSPYMTKFELWHRKKAGDVVEIDTNERMKWGTRLQDAIAEGIAEDNGWLTRKMEEYIRDPELRIGSSFDFEISLVEDSPLVHGFQDRVKGLLEIKNVDTKQFLDGWAWAGDNLEAPPHIELQVQHQMAVAGRAFAYIGALVGGNQVHLLRREADPKIIEQIRRRVREFWLSIDINQEPKPDFRADAEFIAELYNYADPGQVYDAEGDTELAHLVTEDKILRDDIKAAEEGRAAIKAQILMKIGKAERVMAKGFSISAGMIGPATYRVDKKGYRNFRINWKKEKQ